MTERTPRVPEYHCHSSFLFCKESVFGLYRWEELSHHMFCQSMCIYRDQNWQHSCVICQASSYLMFPVLPPLSILSQEPKLISFSLRGKHCKGAFAFNANTPRYRHQYYRVRTCRLARKRGDSKQDFGWLSSQGWKQGGKARVFFWGPVFKGKGGGGLRASFPIFVPRQGRPKMMFLHYPPVGSRFLSTLRDCKQRSLTVSKQALTVSKKLPPLRRGTLMREGPGVKTGISWSGFWTGGGLFGSWALPLPIT